MTDPTPVLDYVMEECIDCMRRWAKWPNEAWREVCPYCLNFSCRRSALRSNDPKSRQEVPAWLRPPGTPEYEAYSKRVTTIVKEHMSMSLRCPKCGHIEPPASGLSGTCPKCDDALMEPMKKEAVDHPDHYGGEDNPYEVIKVIEAWELDFHLGNAVKYIPRAGKKDPSKEVEDLKKAVWYIKRKIKLLEEQEPI